MRRSIFLGLLGVVALVGGLVVAYVRVTEPPFRLRTFYDAAGGDWDVGGVGIVTMTEVVVRRPATILRVSPAHVDRGLDVLAVRAMFQHPDSPSPSGHLTGWAPTNDRYGRATIYCWPSWPVAGFGQSYPVENLHVARGDRVAFLLYARALAPGHYETSGIRVDYRGHRGGPAHVSGSATKLVLDLRRQGEPLSRYNAVGRVSCRKDDGQSWAYATAASGYPA